MKLRKGGKIKFWNVKDIVVEINGDFVNTYSYNNVPIDECELIKTSKKECTCKKLIKDDKVTLITECDLCKNNRRKELKLAIELVNKLIELKKILVPQYKAEKREPIYVKSFKDAWDEIKPNDIIDAIEKQITDSLINKK